jgi:glycosyltransferase involved in cell wall biosynthesis
MKSKKPKLSVLTVTMRNGWEEIAKESLARQTFKDFEWIVISENKVNVPYFPAPPKKNKSNLVASDNEGLRRCRGDYVVFYQDFIWLPDDCLERLYNEADPNTFVTTLTINPPGVERDPRGVVGEGVKYCAPEEWEANVGLAPMGVVRYLGGIDEDYDQGWAWDNCNLAVRAAMIGCQFKIDQNNNPRLLPHAPKPRGLEPNGDFHASRIREIEEGVFPLRLNYLSGKQNETK